MKKDRYQRLLELEKLANKRFQARIDEDSELRINGANFKELSESEFILLKKRCDQITRARRQANPNKRTVFTAKVKKLWLELSFMEQQCMMRAMSKKEIKESLLKKEIKESLLKK